MKTQLLGDRDRFSVLGHAAHGVEKIIHPLSTGDGNDLENVRLRFMFHFYYFTYILSVKLTL